MPKNKGWNMWRAARLLCPLFAVALAACGGGKNNSSDEMAAPTQVDPLRVWQTLPTGQVKSFKVCGKGIVRTTGTAFQVASITYDHGVTWQPVNLTFANPELGDSGYYVGQSGHDYAPPSAFVEETRDCGTTWTQFSLQFQACTHGGTGSIWRGGELNQTLYAQYRDPDSGQYFLCTSADDGQTWTQGPAIPALVGEVRRRAWFAWQTVAPVVPGRSPSYLLFRSNDQGLSWQAEGLRSSSKDFPTTYLQQRLTPSPPVLYVLATKQEPGAEGPIDETLWRWDDAAATWTTVAVPLPLGPGTLWDHSPAVNPVNPQQVFIMTQRPPGISHLFNQRVFETRDAGRIWLEVTNGLFNLDPNFAVFDAFLTFDPSEANQVDAIHYGSPIWALDTRY